MPLADVYLPMGTFVMGLTNYINALWGSQCTFRGIKKSISKQYCGFNFHQNLLYIILSKKIGARLTWREFFLQHIFTVIIFFHGYSIHSLALMGRSVKTLWNFIRSMGQFNMGQGTIEYVKESKTRGNSKYLI